MAARMPARELLKCNSQSASDLAPVLPGVGHVPICVRITEPSVLQYVGMFDRLCVQVVLQQVPLFVTKVSAG